MPDRGTRVGESMRSCSYEDALLLALRKGTMPRGEVLSYFAEDEHGAAGRALDALVVAGRVAFDGHRYRLQVAP